MAFTSLERLEVLAALDAYQREVRGDLETGKRNGFPMPATAARLERIEALVARFEEAENEQ
jgi:hypothetical protein